MWGAKLPWTGAFSSSLWLGCRIRPSFPCVSYEVVNFLKLYRIYSTYFGWYSLVLSLWQSISYKHKDNFINKVNLCLFNFKDNSINKNKLYLFNFKDHFINKNNLCSFNFKDHFINKDNSCLFNFKDHSLGSGFYARNP